MDHGKSIQYYYSMEKRVLIIYIHTCTSQVRLVNLACPIRN